MLTQRISEQGFRIKELNSNMGSFHDIVLRPFEQRHSPSIFRRAREREREVRMKEKQIQEEINSFTFWS